MKGAVQISEYPVERMMQALPKPAQNANKYSRGKLTIIGGNKNYPGSVCLSALAGYRMGAGYVEVFCAPETAQVIHVRIASAVARDWNSFSADSLVYSTSEYKHPRAIAIGSGMSGEDTFEERLICSVLEHAQCPILIDGGAITVLSSPKGRAVVAARSKDASNIVVTPHFGEAARMAAGVGIEMPKSQDEAALAGFASALADAYSLCVVLKGPDTYIAEPNADVVYRMNLGTPALAKAGTGDVLAGMTSALLAQGLSALDASCIGASMHAEAGRLAAASIGEISVMAEDVVDHIAPALLQIV